MNHDTIFQGDTQNLDGFDWSPKIQSFGRQPKNKLDEDHNVYCSLSPLIFSLLLYRRNETVLYHTIICHSSAIY